jgi:hypothetical protein
MIMSVVLMRLSILCAMVDVEDCVAVRPESGFTCQYKRSSASRPTFELRMIDRSCVVAQR